jgi:hypothetical protein
MSVPIAVLFSGRDLRRGSNQLRSVCLKHVKLSFAASVFSNGLWLLASFANTPEASPARLGRQTQGWLKSLATFLGDRFAVELKHLGTALVYAAGNTLERELFDARGGTLNTTRFAKRGRNPGC